MLMWGEKLEMLEHHADPGTQAGQVDARGGEGGAVDHDVAGLEGFESVDAFDEGRLARPRGAADDHHFALGYRRGAVAEHLEMTIVLANLLDLDHWTPLDWRRRTTWDAAKQMAK